MWVCSPNLLFFMFVFCRSAWNLYPNLCIRYRKKQCPLKGICNLYKVEEVKRCSKVMKSLLANIQQISIRAGRAALFFQFLYVRLGSIERHDLAGRLLWIFGVFFHVRIRFHLVYSMMKKKNKQSLILHSSKSIQKTHGDLKESHIGWDF